MYVRVCRQSRPNVWAPRYISALAPRLHAKAPKHPLSPSAFEIVNVPHVAASTSISTTAIRRPPASCARVTTSTASLQPVRAPQLRGLILHDISSRARRRDRSSPLAPWAISISTRTRQAARAVTTASGDTPPTPRSARGLSGSLPAALS
jgi:hypothetical protein